MTGIIRIRDGISSKPSLSPPAFCYPSQMPDGFLSLLFWLLQQQNTKNWYVPNTERLVSGGKHAQTQDLRMCHPKQKALQQNGAQQSWRKHHFQVLERLPQKTAFSSNLANSKLLQFLENQNPQAVSEGLPGSCSCPGDDQRRGVLPTAAGAEVTRPHRAATPADRAPAKLPWVF